MCVLFQLVVYNDDTMIKFLNDVFIAEKQFHTLVANVMSLRKLKQVIPRKSQINLSTKFVWFIELPGGDRARADIYIYITSPA
jgi:hypothetical protein